MFQGSHRGAASWNSYWFGLSAHPLENSPFDFCTVHSTSSPFSCGQAPLIEEVCWVGDRM